MNEPFVIERVYNAPTDKVWKAITDVKQMQEWYFDIKEFKPEVGFVFKFIGGDDCNQYVHICKILEVVPERKLSHTWTYEAHPGIETVVTMELSPEGDNQTRLKLTHTGIEKFAGIDDKNFAPSSFEAGWTDIIGKMLKEYVEQ